MSDLQIYANCMAAIRNRVNRIQTIISGPMGTGDKDMVAEMVFTQFRKIAEELAYALSSDANSCCAGLSTTLRNRGKR